MAWTGSNPVSVGDPTKKAHYDSLWDNADYLKGVIEAEHSAAGAHTDASTTAKGVIEIATNAECVTGTDTTRAVPPDGLQAKLDDDGYVTGPVGNSDMAADSIK